MDALTIVTGASRGLGRALLAAAPAGHRVDVSRSGPPEAASSHIAADLSDPAAWPRVIEEITALVRDRDWQRLVFVQNAGMIEPIGFAGEVDGGRYTSNVLVNSAAPQVLGHGFLRAVSGVTVARDLVVISSGAARSVYPGWSSYGAAKAAVDHWVRTVGAEQQRRGGARVLSVTPGVVATDMQEAVRSADERDFPSVERFHELHATGRLADPDDVARRFWQLLDDPGVASGEVIDLRDR